MRLRYNPYMDRTRRDIEVELGSLIRNARKALGFTQDDVARLVSVAADRPLTQGKVSEHENGRWQQGSIENFAAAYSHALRIPEETMRETLGFTPPGAQPPPPSFEELVRADPTLDEPSKDHIINQYALLQAATRHNRQHPSVAG
jgi:transcriptional regulator with XRE-family HTH domain